MSKEIGSPPLPKGNGGLSPAGRLTTRRQAEKNQAASQAPTALRNCQSAATLMKRQCKALHAAPNGAIHESAICNPGRQELQSISVDSDIHNTGAGGPCTSGLVFGGRLARAPANSLFLHQQ